MANTEFYISEALYTCAKLAHDLKKAGIHKDAKLSYLTDSTRAHLAVLEEMENMANDISLLAHDGEGGVSKNYSELVTSNIKDQRARWNKLKAKLIKYPDFISEQVKGMENLPKEEIQSVQWRALYRYSMLIPSYRSMLVATERRESLEEIEKIAKIVKDNHEEATSDYKKLVNEAASVNVDLGNLDAEIKESNEIAEKAKKEVASLNKQVQPLEDKISSSQAEYSYYSNLAAKADDGSLNAEQLKDVLDILEGRKKEQPKKVKEVKEVKVEKDLAALTTEFKAFVESNKRGDLYETIEKWDKAERLIIRFNKLYKDAGDTLEDNLNTKGELSDDEGKDLFDELSALLGRTPNELKEMEMYEVRDLMSEKQNELGEAVNGIMGQLDDLEGDLSFDDYKQLIVKTQEEHQKLNGTYKEKVPEPEPEPEPEPKQPETEEEKIAAADKILGIEFKNGEGLQQRIEAVKFMLQSKEERQKLCDDKKKVLEENQQSLEAVKEEIQKSEKSRDYHEKRSVVAQGLIEKKEAYKEKHAQYIENRDKILKANPRDYKNRLLKEVSLQAKILYAQKDFKKGDHKNSKEYDNVIKYLDKIQNWHSDEAFIKRLEKGAIEKEKYFKTIDNLKIAAEKYLKAKKAQLRLRPSALRTSRIDYVTSILETANKCVDNDHLNMDHDGEFDRRILDTLESTKNLINGKEKTKQKETVEVKEEVVESVVKDEKKTEEITEEKTEEFDGPEV